MKRILLSVAFFLIATACALAQTITGKVTSAVDNLPLPGVSVLVKGTTTGTTTNADGVYTLNAESNDPVIVFSFIGFKSVEVSAAGRTTIDVSLDEDITSLNEVVVTAFGIEREKKALGYSVSTVSTKEIMAVGNTNFASALYGKAPGVRVSSAPGGATSAVNIQIRGINSLSAGSNQPIFIVDGVMIRNIEQVGQVNNDGYWSDQKIRGNGILDINPADIESLTILKGASAAALYGSDASNGVVVITTKTGAKSKGLGVELNYYYNTERVAFTPKFQNVYGPGYDVATNVANGATANGFIPVDLDGNGSMESLRPYFRAYGQFGPRMDGQEVAWWDGSIRKYSPQKDNYKEFYDVGHNSTFNVALNGSTDKASYRLSYTRLDYKSIAPGSKSNKNTISLNTSLKLHEKVSTDIVINYINTFIHNRPESINRITANYGGFFSRADYMDVYKNKYQTTDGYKYVLYNQTNRNPDEAIKYNIRAADLLEYLWRNVRDNDDEYQDRLISSATLNYDIVKGLKFRGRIGNDFTSVRNDIERHNEYPIAFNSPSASTGSYATNQGRYMILYTDAFLTYTQGLGENFNLTAMGGFQSRRQDYLDHTANTNGGLIDENWFSLTNSTALPSVSATRRRATMYAYLGTLNLSFREYLYLEATARQEYSSTLHPDHNGYFFPSVNAGFVFTDAFTFPTFFSYGKVRASAASIATATEPYRANIAYTQTSLQTPTNGSVPKLGAATEYGNHGLVAESKTEYELGLETRFLNNKFGLDLTWYTNTVDDQIIQLQAPQSTGVRTVLSNVGQLASKGIEIGFNATPFDNGSLRWDTRINFSKNRTKVNSLLEGMNELTTFNLDAGAVLVKAEVGKDIGNIYAHPLLTDDNGSPIIGDDGLFQLSPTYVKVGNVQPKAIGGWSNTISYKGFSLDFLIDYRFGGSLVSAPLLYAYGAGMYESTMKYRDEENGGLPYNVVNGEKVLASSHEGAEFHDGIIIEGVTADGEPNNVIIDAPSYYLNGFGWASGWYQKAGVYKNDFVKLREAALGYNLPKSISDKVGFQNIRVSLIGRNLLYLYRTLENLDPEAALGTSWTRQGIDEGSMAATRSYGFSIHGSF
jgi:iron complex outermembrane recepter protein